VDEAEGSQMITRDEAERIAEQWVAESAPPDVSIAAELYEFDLGYVVWGQQPPTDPPLYGANQGIIDRETGELSVWPSLPVEMIIKRFRAKKVQRPQTRWAWDPAEQARWDLRHVPTPTNSTHLTMADRTVVSRSVKGADEPNHHLLVREVMRAGLSPEYRERGYDRCSEAAAFSDALHDEDARRVAANQRPITLEEARTVLFAGAAIVTYRVREPGDPVGGKTAPPCVSCALLGAHFGFPLSPPNDSGPEPAGGAGGSQQE
jgi:hypothetical protein